MQVFNLIVAFLVFRSTFVGSKYLSYHFYITGNVTAFSLKTFILWKYSLLAESLMNRNFSSQLNQEGWRQLYPLAYFERIKLDVQNVFGWASIWHWSYYWRLDRRCRRLFFILALTIQLLNFQSNLLLQDKMSLVNIEWLGRWNLRTLHTSGITMRK
jgi:hypothetical protein